MESAPSSGPSNGNCSIAGNEIYYKALKYHLQFSLTLDLLNAMT